MASLGSQHEKDLGYFQLEIESGLTPAEIWTPVVGVVHGRPIMYDVANPQSLIWQRDFDQYGVTKKLPPLPPLFLPTLFSPSSMNVLRREVYSIFNTTGLSLESLNRRVVLFEVEDDPLSPYPWDAGLEIVLKWKGKDVRIFGPAVVSFDHEVADGVKAGKTSYGHFEDIVQAHINQLRFSYFDMVAIHMPHLGDRSTTGGLFASTHEYRRLEFDIEGKPYELHCFRGDSKSLWEYSHASLSDAEYYELLGTEAFGRMLKFFSSVWNSNFSREIKAWPLEYDDKSLQLSQELVAHIESKFNTP